MKKWARAGKSWKAEEEFEAPKAERGCQHCGYVGYVTRFDLFAEVSAKTLGYISDRDAWYLLPSVAVECPDCGDSCHMDRYSRILESSVPEKRMYEDLWSESRRQMHEKGNFVSVSDSLGVLSDLRMSLTVRKRMPGRLVDDWEVK